MQMEAAVSPSTVSVGFGERFVAYIIDLIILTVVSVVVNLILGQLIGGLLGLAISVGYYGYFWSTTGQTVGKMVMGLKVVSAENGGVIDIGTALLRWVGYFISGIAIGLGFLWILWDPMHDGWHDKIAKTKVIKVSKA